MAALEIVALEGDQTGQELLEQALRVLDPEVLGIAIDLVRFDLSLENRRRTSNASAGRTLRLLPEPRARCAGSTPPAVL